MVLILLNMEFRWLRFGMARCYMFRQSTVGLVGCKVRDCAIDITTTMYHMVICLISHHTEMPGPTTHPLQPYQATPSFHWGSLTC